MTCRQVRHTYPLTLSSGQCPAIHSMAASTDAQSHFANVVEAFSKAYTIGVAGWGSRSEAIQSRTSGAASSSAKASWATLISKANLYRSL